MREWTEEGHLYYEGYFRDGVAEGIHYAWRENGGLCTKIVYRAGEVLAKQEWNASGKLLYTVKYD